MKSLHPKNYTIIELINGDKYLIKSSDYITNPTDGAYPAYWRLIVWTGTNGGFEWKKCKGTIHFNTSHILTVKRR